MRHDETEETKGVLTTGKMKVECVEVIGSCSRKADQRKRG
jgi:hypothetical protein